MGSVDLAGLTEKVTKGRWKTVYYEDADGNIVAKVCRKCGELKLVGDYHKDKEGIGGVKPRCKEDNLEYARKYHVNNLDHRLEYNRKHRADNSEYYARYREDNKEFIAKRMRKYYEDTRDHRLNTARIWGQSNRDKRNLTKVNYRARKRCLPDNLTGLHRGANNAHFGNSCVLTGESDKLDLDHVIPLSTGHGGTTQENCVPMSASLNASKGDRNIFEWFPQVKERYGLSQRKFDELVTYLAKLNGLSPKEYEDFVYWCHDNPRTVEETEADNERYGYKKSSIEIWREFTQDKAIS